MKRAELRTGTAGPQLTASGCSSGSGVGLLFPGWPPFLQLPPHETRDGACGAHREAKLKDQQLKFPDHVDAMIHGHHIVNSGISGACFEQDKGPAWCRPFKEFSSSISLVWRSAHSGTSEDAIFAADRNRLCPVRPNLRHAAWMAFRQVSSGCRSMAWSRLTPFRRQ